MNLYVNAISGIDDAMVSMLMSKRSWTREKEIHLREICQKVLRPNGSLKDHDFSLSSELEEFTRWMDKLVKWGQRHITILRFIDMSVTVEGLHRAGQDDWDSHAKRFNNRIIRSSTRLADFSYELSDWYKDKIIPTDLALKEMGITLPDVLEYDGDKYVKSINGYIKSGHENNPDVKRGLYMLSIPSNFIFKVDLAEWSHVYKERNQYSNANPEVKQLCEGIAEQLQQFHGQLTRDLFLRIPN